MYNSSGDKLPVRKFLWVLSYYEVQKPVPGKDQRIVIPFYAANGAEAYGYARDFLGKDGVYHSQFNPEQHGFTIGETKLPPWKDLWPDGSEAVRIN